MDDLSSMKILGAISEIQKQKRDSGKFPDYAFLYELTAQFGRKDEELLPELRKLYTE